MKSPQESLASRFFLDIRGVGEDIVQHLLKGTLSTPHGNRLPKPHTALKVGAGKQCTVEFPITHQSHVLNGAKVYYYFLFASAKAEQNIFEIMTDSSEQQNHKEKNAGSWLERVPKAGV